ncbi:Asparagine--tRNA ligase, cytoplasmic 2 [Apostasia shenzhenica]|uniref:Asparagine--tRNA ligase, cytoplasmic 2 n=1 Tax=Apostasia shenzhenica TaxID=1088818 RepID=A0A2I0ACR1_9ASPA|nr:Asparagine--tRNA ligase, cytoplasmic 2 [Apostasia shenzhenica]
MASEATASGCTEGLGRPPPPPAVELFKYSKRVLLKSILGRADGGMEFVGERVVVGGWVKSCEEKRKPNLPAQALQPPPPAVVKDTSCTEFLVSRLHILRPIVMFFTGCGCSAVSAGKQDSLAKPLPGIGLLRISDGSCAANLQIFVDSSLIPLSEISTIGTSILVEGVIAKQEASGKQVLELKVEKVFYVGSVDAKNYAISNGKLSVASLRAYPHLCPRTTKVACITRIRNSLSYAAHQFFQSNSFLHVHMPILTSTNLRINGNMLEVATPLSPVEDQAAKTLGAVKAAIKENCERIEELKRSNGNKATLIAALQDLHQANELALQLEQKQNSSLMKVVREDFSRTFFGRQIYLTNSAGLHLESYACSLGSVYSLGPTFQAECSLPTKDLAESWKVEVELAFAELEDAINCAEDCLRYLCQYIMENCRTDLKFMSKTIDNQCLDRIKSTISSNFVRITYKEVMEVLKKLNSIDLIASVLIESSFRFLADEIYQQPVIIYEYPKDLKPFFMRIRDDGETVSAFDIIVPKLMTKNFLSESVFANVKQVAVDVGNLIQGGQKEERLDKITARMKERCLAEKEIEWYLDLRRHGTVEHSGFRIGFEEMVMFITGLDDIRDAIPFPRAKGSADI